MPVSNIQTRATLIGLTAPVCWGMTVGLIRSITESFGLAAGLTLLYGATIVFLYVLLGRPRLRAFPRKYLFFGIPLANVCSICFCLSMYLSAGGQQTVEVGMINYTWPCLVVLFAILFVLNSAMRGAGDSLYPMVNVVASVILLRVPFLYLLANRFGPDAMYWSYGICWGEKGALICRASGGMCRAIPGVMCWPFAGLWPGPPIPT